MRKWIVFKPDLSFCFPLSKQVLRNGIGQVKREKVARARLFPVWKSVLCLPSLRKRIEVAEVKVHD